MNIYRIKKLQLSLERPILIKKKENLLYLTGRCFMNGYLLVMPRKNAEFNAEGRGSESVIFLGDGLEKIEGVRTDFLKNVGKYIKPKEMLEVFGEFTYAEVKYIRSKNPELRIEITIKHDPVDYQRMIKEPGEIVLVKKSMQIVERVFELLKKKLVRHSLGDGGWSEIKLAQFIQNAGLKMGAEDISFPAIVASGANAAVPHHVPSNKRLKAGESIIIDFGFKYKNYCSDFTRTVFLKKVPKKLEIAYNQVERAYNECMSLRGVQPTKQSHQSERLPRPSDALGARNDRGITGNDFYQRAVDVLSEKHLDKYFIHSLGHGTGLEIHELPNLSPNSKDKIRDGMVFSIEPGVYIPKLGGIRIEDLVYLEKGDVKKFIKVPTNLVDNIIN